MLPTDKPKEDDKEELFEEEDAFLLTKTKLRNDMHHDQNHVKDITEDTLKMLGHEWNFEWI